MPKPRRNIQSAAEETITPPADLTPTQRICRVRSAAGNNLYQVTCPDASKLLVELAQRFRSTIWIRRGGFVLVDTATLADRDNKIGGEIINIVRDEKQWAKMSWWPAEFKLVRRDYGDSDDEDSKVGQLPPSDSEDEG
ncbi:putative S1-like domain-containing protein [Myriangium duriaei CBS 260.36]|uniref:S1-like domain-containing protein n=1 Tax=Myriangium duriaei CBS 260.36 TaxID=1168546 RepID=A0A9P4J4Q1_9PEZI|nr:putative S1-like domain-containing protein [Myriangium duriaei CBS 260.36]